MFCNKCGTKNEKNAKFCENCGYSLTEQKEYQSNTTEKTYNDTAEKKPSNLLVILGYIFAVLSGIIGAVIGLYLYTRNDSYKKVHGRNILVISVVFLIVGAGVAVFAWQSIPTFSSGGMLNLDKDMGSVQQIQNKNQTENNTEQQGNSPQTISSAQAKNIAYNFAQQYAPGAKAGTPTLSGNTYNVPLYGNGNLVGEVKVNAQNGNIVSYWFQEMPSGNDME